jgi:hypothetical protein
MYTGKQAEQALKSYSFKTSLPRNNEPRDWLRSVPDRAQSTSTGIDAKVGRITFSAILTVMLAWIVGWMLLR